MKDSTAAMRSLTEVAAAAMARLVMIPNKISTMFNHDPEVAVQCFVTPGCLSSHAFTAECLWVS